MKTCGGRSRLWRARYPLISLWAVGVGASITKLTKWRHIDRLPCLEPIASHDEKAAVVIVMAVSREPQLVYRCWEIKARFTRKL